MPNIIDVIHHPVPAYNMTQLFVVIDQPLQIKYERHGDLLLGEDDGFFSAYRYERPYGTGEAFGGAVFDIPMVDGTVTNASGQWWSVQHPRRYECTDVGVGTIEGLNKCNVFKGGIVVLTSKYEAWLAQNTPSTDYHKYDTRLPHKKAQVPA